MRNQGYDPESPGWIDPHPPERIGDMTKGRWLFEPDCDPPETRQQQCALCRCNFLSVPQWLLTRWQYPSICVHCGDNYSHRQAIINDKRPRTIFINNPGPKRHICPGCHQGIMVSAVKDGAYWAYKGPCPECGEEFENLYYAYKAVPKSENTSTPSRNLDDLD